MNPPFAAKAMTLRTKVSSVLRALFLLAAVAGLGQVGARAQSQDDVTVAFLYNFARFVDWPSIAFASDSAPFVVGFLNRPVLADKFAQAVQGKNVNGRELTVRKLERPEEAAGCQIVFTSDASLGAGLVAAAKGKPILCVGQGPEFLAAGGMIAFSRDGARLVFDVNLSVIREATLTPADKLAKAARSKTGG